MVGKKVVPAGPGHLPDRRRALRRRCWSAVILIVGALTFFPALALGPDRRALPRAGRKGVLTMATHPQQSRLALRRRDPPAGDRWTACASSRPRHVAKNPVMFVVEVGSVLTTVLWLRDLVAPAGRRRAALVHRRGHALALVHVLFANFAEAVAEGRGKAQADALRKMRKETTARRLRRRPGGDGARLARCARATVVVVEAGELIPGDGEVIEGIASVDESAITGESAPVIRESGGDRSRGHRRHQGALRPHRRAHHRRPGRVVPRPDDRAGRGRRAPEDAERDRAAHPARRADAHLPVRLRDAGAARALLGRRALGDR